MAQSSTNTQCKQNEEKETHGLIPWLAFVVAGDDWTTIVAGGGEEVVGKLG